jgi:hypothetical protein
MRPAIVITSDDDLSSIEDEFDQPIPTAIKRQHRRRKMRALQLATALKRNSLSVLDRSADPDILAKITDQVSTKVVDKLFSDHELSAKQRTFLAITIGTTLWSIIVHTLNLTAANLPSWSKWLTTSALITQIISLLTQIALLFPGMFTSIPTFQDLCSTLEEVKSWLLGASPDTSGFTLHPVHIHGESDSKAYYPCHSGCIHQNDITYGCGCTSTKIILVHDCMSEDLIMQLVDRSARLLGSTIILTSTMSGHINPKDIVLYGNLLKAKNTILDEVVGLPKDLYKTYSEITGSPSEGLYARYEALAKEGSKLNQMTMSDILPDPAHCHAIDTFHDRATTAIRDLSRDKENRNASHLIRMITLHVSPLATKASAIKDIIKGRSRIDPPAIVLGGSAAIGKTRFMTYLHEEVAQRYGLNNDRLYNMAVKEGYYQFAQNESGFYYDDWLTHTPDDDELLKDFNRLFSSEAFAIETAGLEGKHQHLLSRIGYMTTNFEYSSLLSLDKKHRVFATKKNLDACISRLSWFNVEDKYMEANDLDGRSDYLPHRQKDFSHLTITKYKANKQGAILKEVMTVKQVVDYICKQLAQREISHLRLMKTTEVDARIKILSDSWIGKVNACAGQSFFVVRMQGPGDTGKTGTAKKLAADLADAYDMPVETIASLVAVAPSHRAVVIIDDLLINEQDWKNYYTSLMVCIHSALYY